MSEDDFAIAWTAPGRRALARLPEKVATAAVEFLYGSLAANPHRVGKPLKLGQARLPSFGSRTCERTCCWAAEVDGQQRTLRRRSPYHLHTSASLLQTREFRCCDKAKARRGDRRHRLGCGKPVRSLLESNPYERYPSP